MHSSPARFPVTACAPLLGASPCVCTCCAGTLDWLRPLLVVKLIPSVGLSPTSSNLRPPHARLTRCFGLCSAMLGSTPLARCARSPSTAVAACTSAVRRLWFGCAAFEKWNVPVFPCAARLTQACACASTHVRPPMPVTWWRSTRAQPAAQLDLTPSGLMAAFPHPGCIVASRRLFQPLLLESWRLRGLHATLCIDRTLGSVTRVLWGCLTCMLARCSLCCSLPVCMHAASRPHSTVSTDLHQRASRATDSASWCGQGRGCSLVSENGPDHIRLVWSGSVLQPNVCILVGEWPQRLSQLAWHSRTSC